MYTSSNTALGRKKEKIDGFVFLYLKSPRCFLLQLFVQTCAPDHSHRTLLSRPWTLLAHLCFLLLQLFVQTCVPDHSHRALLSRPWTLLAHLCFLSFFGITVFFVPEPTSRTPIMSFYTSFSSRSKTNLLVSDYPTSLSEEHHLYNRGYTFETQSSST
jgi:hypothetical protein